MSVEDRVLDWEDAELVIVKKKARDDRAGPTSRTRVEEETTDIISAEFDNLLDTLMKRNGLAEG